MGLRAIASATPDLREIDPEPVYVPPRLGPRADWTGCRGPATPPEDARLNKVFEASGLSGSLPATKVAVLYVPASIPDL